MSVKDPVVTTWHLKVNNSRVRTQPATQTKSINPLRSDKQNNMISKNLMQAEEKQDPRAPLLYTGCHRTFIIAASAADCFTICLDNEDDVTWVKLMKTMMCEAAVTHCNMLTDYSGYLPQQW